MVELYFYSELTDLEIFIEIEPINLNELNLKSFLVRGLTYSKIKLGN